MVNTAQLKIGQLAKRTGLTVRTLHHYEEIGLLVPSMRTETGHRLYGADDVQRLQHILLLRQTGFALEDIRDCLNQPGFGLREAVQLRLARLRKEMGLLRQLQARLEALDSHLASAEEVSVEEFLNLIEAMTMINQYYTPEQLEQLKQRAEAYGEDRLRQYEAEWAELIAQARAEMEKDTDPSDEKVQRIAARSQELIEAFTGGDPGIRQSLNAMYRQEGPEKASHGAVDAAVFEYMGKARACLPRK